MKILLKVIAFFFLLTNFSNADLTKPNTSLKPFDVLMIQLNSLQNNNVPYKDAGIEQTWEFAHPSNRIFTGPLKKFTSMMYSSSYSILLDHQDHKIILVNKNQEFAFFVIEICCQFFLYQCSV